MRANARSGSRVGSRHAPTISCMVCWMNSSNESSCCPAKPFSSKKELITVQASSCPISSSSSKSSPPIWASEYRVSILAPADHRFARARPRVVGARRAESHARTSAGPRALDSPIGRADLAAIAPAEVSSARALARR